jgi:hypothetical protein
MNAKKHEFGKSGKRAFIEGKLMGEQNGRALQLLVPRVP